MNTTNKLELITHFINENIDEHFHNRVKNAIEVMTLKDLIGNKNPYLYRAKDETNANDLIAAMMRRTISASEETSFGDFMELVAVEVCRVYRNGHKSAVKGIDVEFHTPNEHYIISVKSGKKWGNAGSKAKMADYFKSAKRTLKTSIGSSKRIICVEGIMYGKLASRNVNDYITLIGEGFWKLLSDNNSNLYTELIEPLGVGAFERRQSMDAVFNAKLNSLVKEFIDRYCHEGEIFWDWLVKDISSHTQ